MPFIAECPSCGQKLKVPENLTGKKVRCSKCAGTFVAGSAITESPPASTPSSRSRPRNEEPSERQEHDDFDFEQEEEERPARRSRRGRSRRDYSDSGDPGRGGMVLTLGIISIAMAALALLLTFVVGLFVPLIGLCGYVFVIIGLVMGIMAWSMGSSDLKKIRSGRIASAAEGSTRGGYITGMIGTIINTLYLICNCLLFIIGVIFGIALVSRGGIPQQQNQFGPPRRFSLDLPPAKVAPFLPAGRTAR